MRASKLRVGMHVLITTDGRTVECREVARALYSAHDDAIVLRWKDDPIITSYSGAAEVSLVWQLTPHPTHRFAGSFPSNHKER